MKTEAPAMPSTKQCPYCAETIRLEAEKCRHCGSDLTQSLVRRLTLSPVLPAASIIIGITTSTLELVQFLTSSADPTGFGPADTPSEDEGSALVLIAAVLVGATGFLGALLIRRRPIAASLVLGTAGMSGLLAVAIGGMNWLLVVLSGLLLVVAAVTALSSLGVRRPLPS